MEAQQQHLYARDLGQGRAIVLALALNAYAVLGLRVARKRSGIVGTLRLEVRLWNVVVVVATTSLRLCMLAGYVFVKNFTQAGGTMRS